MSKESVRASIERKKDDIARMRDYLAGIRKRKSESAARYAAQIKTASSPASKESLRRHKEQDARSFDQQIRQEQTKISQAQYALGLLREQLKREK